MDLFKNFICSKNLKAIDGPAVIDFQYYLKKQRQNCGASINRKLFTLRCYGNFLKLYDLPCADALPFYDVLKIRQGYRKRPNALTTRQITLLFKTIDTDTILGIRDYAVYALMYQLGLRVGEVPIHLILPILILKTKRSRCSAKVKSREPCTSTMSYSKSCANIFLCEISFVTAGLHHRCLSQKTESERLWRSCQVLNLSKN